MKKKIIALTVAAILLIMAVVGGTYAYLIDKDYAENVMVMGNVDIIQEEWERAADGSIVEFTQDKPLYPAVMPNGISWAADEVTVGGGAVKVFADDCKNVVDKFITVKNTGKSDAYVRTLIAFEQGSLAWADYFNAIMTNTNGEEWESPVSGYEITINGENFIVFAMYYKGDNNGVLAPEEITAPCLNQLYMLSTATNETVTALDGNENGKYDIYAISQAVQTNGFTDAHDALNTAFGVVEDDGDAAYAESQANLQEWFETEYAAVVRP